MKLHTVAVLGAGPGGLYAARLLKRHHPNATVSVYEQNVPGWTFGFGVGLATTAQRRIQAADREAFQAIQRASLQGRGAAMMLGTQTVHLEGTGEIGIGRNTLLSELHRLAIQSGVEVHYGQRRAAGDLTADIIVAADGVNSATRTALAGGLGVEISVGKGLYLWCGADFALDYTVFVPKSTEFGVFTIHAYPYARDRSTFLIETDHACWKAAGFDKSTAATPVTDTDHVSLTYLEKVFADELNGRPLIGNKSRWSQFRTVTCRQWFANNIVLLGDAAHTAHYSIGSGTKLAMEDAIALDEAIAEHDDLPTALAAYQMKRQGPVGSLQRAALHSQHWWDTFTERLHQPVETLMVSFMTRTGRFSLERLAKTAPDLTHTALTLFSGTATPDGDASDLSSWTLAQPLTFGKLHFPRRVVTTQDFDGRHVTVLNRRFDAFSEAAEKELASLRAKSSLPVLWLCGPNDTEHMLGRLEFAERVRAALPSTLTVVEGPSSAAPYFAAALAAQRTHLVSYRDHAGGRI